jgi:hypothetical protein
MCSKCCKGLVLIKINKSNHVVRNLGNRPLIKLLCERVNRENEANMYLLRD